MAVKDEINIANMIMNQPRIPMGHDVAKHILGGSTTGPSLQTQVVEEITLQDARRPQARPQASRQDAIQVQRDIAAAGKITGNTMLTGSQTVQRQLTEDVGFEQAVENLFDSVNLINESISEYANTAGRVSRRMHEKWQVVLESLKEFELYYDRTMNKLT